jgi:putative PEP-CTERM system histidine kinase
VINLFITIVAILALVSSAGYALYQERNRAGLLLFAALTATALLELCDILALNSANSAFFWKTCALSIEALLPPLWILCSLTYARQSGPWKIGSFSKIAVALTLLFSLLPYVFERNAFFYAPDFPAERLLFLGTAGLYFYIAIMACLVIALVNFEVTFSNASPDARWKIKFELIGLGSILAVLVFYFSQALLYRSLNMNYLQVRSLLYLVAAILMIYPRVFRRGGARIQVSRQVAFKSIVLFAVGIYLVVLGLLGEGMQHFGSFLPRTITISMAFLIGIALLILILSERVRREVKVVLHKNFYQHKHDYRTQWLRFTEQLSSSRSGEELLRRILSAYCDIFGISGSALFLFEEERRGYCLVDLNEIDLPDQVIAKNNSLIQFMTKCAWVVSISEENHEISSEDLEYFKKNQVAFVVPLFSDGGIEGFIVLGRPVNTKEVYIYEDYDLMKTIARQASLAIMHHKLSEQISHTREMEAIGNVATFVAHDLKNLVSNLSLIVENSARHIHNPEFQQDMLASLDNTVTKMRKLIGRLKNLGEQHLINRQEVNLLELARKTARMFMGSEITVAGTAEIVRVDESEIQKVILNLLVNAMESSSPNDPIEIEVGHSGLPYIRVSDQGCGMSPRFLRTDLFKPFRTSKKLGLGIGLYQCRQIVLAHGGKIDVSSTEGSGSIFTVWFAAADETGNTAA